MRVLVCKDGQVDENYRTFWQKLVSQEASDLQEIDAQMREEDPEIFLNVPVPENWLTYAENSIISASYRLGCGEVWLDIEA